MTAAPLNGMRVLEIGSRLGVSACGRLLADLGADVFVLEPRTPTVDGKWIDRAQALAERHSILFDPNSADDRATLIALTQRCDVALTSSDTDSWPDDILRAIASCAICCDITAFGNSGPRAGQRADEQHVQALTGVMDTTGFSDGPATPIGIPVLDMSSGIYAACATTFAYRVLNRDGVGQHIDVALFDTAINALATFLPAHFGGKAARRLGNGHSMAVPWNAFETQSGWILICSANDVQWMRLATLIGPDVATDVRYATLADRLARRAEVDALVAAWARTQSLDALAPQLLAAGIPCGPIVTLPDLSIEPNLALRQAIVELIDPQSGRKARVPTSLIKLDGQPSTTPRIGRPDAGRAHALALSPRPARATAGHAPHPPFHHLRVIEIGQFTTAPLAARHLASFGADVIKVEPAEGDAARAWAPHRDGTSHFFVLSNGEKRSLALDLRSAVGRAEFERLLGSADVLVENMKPGSLVRLGFNTARLREINPRLVYCAISGFGARSAYEGRPAFDTVVQAMCGMMDATRVDGVPLKSGVSAADIGGGQIGLLAIAAALERRERTGTGASIDIAMQDVGAWLTQSRWNNDRVAEPYRGPVATVADACLDAQTRARDLILIRHDATGTPWEMLGSPLRLAATPPRVGTPIGPSMTGPMDWADAAAAAAKPETERAAS